MQFSSAPTVCLARAAPRLRYINREQRIYRYHYCYYNEACTTAPRLTIQYTSAIAAHRYRQEENMETLETVFTVVLLALLCNICLFLMILHCFCFSLSSNCGPGEQDNDFSTSTESRISTTRADTGETSV